MPMYHHGNRELQEQFGSVQLADRLVDRLWRSRFKDEDKSFIEAREFFFLATADADGRPDCSFKGGPKGFVRIAAPDCLEFPDYDGNGMFKSLGNIRANGRVGLLFIAMDGTPKRLRVNGQASVHDDAQSLRDVPGAQLLVRVVPDDIFPNCPRYVPNLSAGTSSEYLPCEGQSPKEPAWKGFDAFKDVVPPRVR